jgi:tripeptide aminopeptidase
LTYSPIVEDFLEIVTTPSHCLNERALADLMKSKLQELGCQVEEDSAGAKIGGDSGNIIARLPGAKSAESVLFSAHLDRVSNPGKITPIVKIDEDKITSDGTTILGADDASGLAAVIDGIRRLKQSGLEHGEVEIVFTVAEEIGLQGSAAMDLGRLKSKIAYVIDTSGDVGVLVNQAPTQRTVKIRIHGKSSHAGMEPEKGINAIKAGAVALSRLREGRLSPITTSNFGVIQGGQATNIVCDMLYLKGEARSHDEGELSAYCEEVEQTFRKAAKEAGATVEFAWNLEYSAFKVAKKERVVTVASQALAALGLKAKIVRGGGGLDANNFNLAGIKSLGLSPGYKNVHSPNESQSISQLILCGQAVFEIIKTVALQG